MIEKKGNLPLDTRLLSDAIIELNISRHNVAIYPRKHPIVEKSLNLAFSFLQKLFELRKEITLAVAKDTLIIDDYSLDKQNPVYREFALSLSSLNIAYVSFKSGLTIEELYSFHSFILKDTRDLPPEEIEGLFKEYKLKHITTGFIDYSAFNLVEGATEDKEQEVSISEKYLFGLLEGKLQTGDAAEFIHDIPPEKLASLINIAGKNKLSEDSYDKVITSYIRKSSERAFSAGDMKKLTDFINGLKPELKQQFLTSAVNTVSEDLDSVKKSLGDMSVDDVIELISIINEQTVAIPKALKNVLDKFSDLHHESFEAPFFEGKPVEDDILLSPEVISFLKEASFDNFVSDSYQGEIQDLLKFDAKQIDPGRQKELEGELENEFVEDAFHNIVLEIISSENYDVMPEEEYEFFVNILKEETEQSIGTGQFLQVLKTLEVLGSCSAKNRFADLASSTLKEYHSLKFISSIINSLMLFGREKREEAAQLCKYYGEKIIPPLMDALSDEESLANRRFILSIITRFREKAVAEAVKRLDDDRWFIQRNMLFILNECGSRDDAKLVLPYCNSKNQRVSFEAVKFLLKFKDDHAVTSLKRYLRSEYRDLVIRAAALAGAFRVKEVVPDLMRVLKKKAISGIDFNDKIHIVKALGQIGDCRALDTLRDVLSSKTFILKGSLKKLKDAIYASLDNYDHKASKELIDKHERQEKTGKGKI